MKLFRATVSWRYKGDRKFWHQSACILAEDLEQARERFEEECPIPCNGAIAEHSLRFVSEVENGMFVCKAIKS